jgi:hypothetical protein
MPIEEDGNENKCKIFQIRSNSDKIIHKSSETLLNDLTKSHSLLKRIGLWICGIESAADEEKEQINDDKSVEQFQADNFMKEPKFWSKVLNINMVFQLSLSGFMWIFFNKFQSM